MTLTMQSNKALSNDINLGGIYVKDTFVRVICVRAVYIWEFLVKSVCMRGDNTVNYFEIYLRLS